MTELGNIKEMSEQEIREHIVVKVKDWKSKLSKLADGKNAVSVKLVCVQLDVSEQEEVELLEKEFEKTEKDVSERIEALLKKDRELGLYSLALSKIRIIFAFQRCLPGS